MRKARHEEIKISAMLFAPRPADGVPVLVKIDGFEIKTNPRRTVAVVRPVASTGTGWTVPLSELQVQDGGGDPSKPTSVIETPDKPPTQIVHTPGINVSAIGAPGAPDAVVARPGTIEQDSKIWKVSCLSCPAGLASCAEGERVGDRHYKALLRCEHARGLRVGSGKVFVGCAAAG